MRFMYERVHLKGMNHLGMFDETLKAINLLWILWWKEKVTFRLMGCKDDLRAFLSFSILETMMKR
jgi:hypothetical protein